MENWQGPEPESVLQVPLCVYFFVHGGTKPHTCLCVQVCVCASVCVQV